MKSQKSFAARGALALVAAGSALAFTACSAGQITQTGSQVAAVNGVSGSEGYATVRDVAVVVDANDDLALKFTAGNLADNDQPIRLESIDVEGTQVSNLPTSEIEPGCNIVSDAEASLKRAEKDAKGTTCNTFSVAKLDGLKDVYLGGHKDVTFNFSNGSIDLSAPVVAFNPKAGTIYRLNDGQLVDEENYHTGADHEGGHGEGHH